MWLGAVSAPYSCSRLAETFAAAKSSALDNPQRSGKPVRRGAAVILVKIERTKPVRKAKTPLKPLHSRSTTCVLFLRRREPYPRCAWRVTS